MTRRTASSLLAAAMVLASCQASEPPETSTTISVPASSTSTISFAEPSFRVAVVGKPADLNWWAAWGSPGSEQDRVRLFDATASLFTGTSLEPVADLAIEPLGVPRPEGNAWVVDQRITPDRHWSDGVPIVASDLVFYFDVVRSLSLDGHHPGAEGVLAVEALDDFTVRIRFDRAPGPGLWPGEVGTAPFVPAQYWTPLIADIGDRPALYGLDAPDPPRAVDPAITWVEAESRHGAYELLVEGAVDLVHDQIGIEGLERDTIARLEGSSEVELTTSVRSPVRTLAFNQRHAPFDDPVLRIALAALVDRGELATALDVAPAYSFHDPQAQLPSGPGTFDESLDRRSRLEAAVGMLSGSGYRWSVPPDIGDGVPGSGLTTPDGSTLGRVQLLVAGSDPLRVDAARWIADRFGDVGLEVEVVAVPADDLAGAVLPPLTPERATSWSMAVLGWRSTGPIDPGALLIHLFHSAEDSLRNGGTNVTGFDQPDFDVLADRYSVTSSPRQAAEVLGQMERAVLDQFPQLPLYRETLTEAHASRLPFISVVDGISSNPSTWPIQFP